DIAGTFWVDRQGYDRLYGIVDATWHQYAVRYNLWEKSHADVPCDTHATCESWNYNSTCDLQAKRCAIPLMDRKLRPVPWYADDQLPERYVPVAARAVAQWNSALVRAIAYAREAECRRGNLGNRNDCHALFFDGPIDVAREDSPKSDQGSAFVFCHNPVQQGDPSYCGAEGTRIRKGDLRHHMIAWWTNPSVERPLGVVVLGGDPTTGEQVGTMVNVFGASIDSYTARARDQLQLLTGDFTPEEFVSGLASQVYGTAISDRALGSLATRLTSVPSQALQSTEVRSRISALKVRAMAGRFTIPTLELGPAAQLVTFGHFAAQQQALGVPGFGGVSEYSAKLDPARASLARSGLEASMVNDLWRTSLGIPTGATSDSVLETFSPLRGLAPDALASVRDARQERLASKGICVLDVPEALPMTWMAGTAAKLKARYPDGAVAQGDLAQRAGVAGQTIDRVVRGKLIYQELLEPLYEFTVLHELGHLVGLAHDFSGSWDSPNFDPNYWLLRSGGVTSNMKPCPTEGRKAGDPDTCVGPRWRDPVTRDELGTVAGREHDSIEAYAVSTVMDYKFDSVFTARLGAFDQMAAKVLYGGIVEIMDDDAYSLIPSSRAMGLSYQWSLGLMNADFWLRDGDLAHYTQMARDLDLFDPRRCRDASSEELALGRGQLGKVCALPHKDHALLRDMEPFSPISDLLFGYAHEKRGVGDLKGRARWPYKVGDGRTSYAHQAMYDTGADFYEITGDALERYDLQYFQTFFRAGRREWLPSTAGRALASGFFDRIQQLQWNATASVIRRTLGGRIDPTTFTNDDDLGKLLSLTLLFDAMQASLLRPQPGPYKRTTVAGMRNDLFVTADPKDPVGLGTGPGAFFLGLGAARYIDNDYDFSKQFDYQAYATRAGSFLEKPYAAIALTDSRPKLMTVARESYLDGRNVMFSFRAVLPLAFDRLVAGVFADDWDTVAPYVVDGEPTDSAGGASLHAVRLWEDTVGSRPAGSHLVDPMLGYRIKLPAMLLMLLYQPIDSNMELVNKTRIWIEGGPEAIDVPQQEKVLFFDPYEGVAWTARTFGHETLAGKRVDTGIGARLLEHANELLGAAYDVELEDYPEAPLGQRRVLYGTDGRPRPTGGAYAVKDSAALARLRLYVGFLHTTRQALFALGYGPCGRGEGC
ncbi:MAG: hypothetical protein WCI05_08445, partial [Myxococcales bacterium]